MIGRAGKRILAVLLIGTIITSNCFVQTSAAGAEETLTQNETENGDNTQAAEDTTQEGQEEDGQETEEKMESAALDESNESSEESSEENSVENLSDTDTGIMLFSENTGTFSSLQELITFCENNKDASGMKDALTFSDDQKTITANANGLILLSCVENQTFEGYTIRLNKLSGSGSDLTSPISGFEQYRFHGLGSTEYPFSGTIALQQASETSINVILDTPFFNVLDVTKAKLGDSVQSFQITAARESVIAFAQTVKGTSENWSSVEIRIDAYQSVDGETTTFTYPGACIGTIEENAGFSLKKVSYTSAAKVSEDTDNAGLLCNTLKAGSNFNVAEVQVSNTVNVTSKKAAGGLIGCMEAGASLTVGNSASLTIDDQWTVTGKNAGGLIGEATDAVLTVNAEINNAKVITQVQDGSSGGLIGTYHLTSTASESAFKVYENTGSLRMTNVTLDAVGKNSYIGALFGILELSADFTINGADVQSTAGIPKSDGKFNLDTTTTYGGIVGQVIGTGSQDNLPALWLNNTVSAVSTANKDITYYGGLAGAVGKPGIDNANPNGAYVAITGHASVTGNGNIITADTHYFGGAVGSMFYHSVLEIKEGAVFTPTASGIKYGGGVAGATGRGSTLRLAGTTDLTAISFAAPVSGQNPGTNPDYRLTCGQVVGMQNASVIYAVKSWVFNRPTTPGETDDIGNYGSVIRLGKNIGQGSETLGESGGLSETLISQDSTTHKTVFASPAQLNNGVISIKNADEFALLAIAEQTYGDFGIYPSVTQKHILNGNTVQQIVFTADIDLSNTGISGLQRDFFYNDSYAYTGVLDGQGHKLTLDIGQIYANNGDGAGNGQIHGHSQVGLFSQANAVIQNLTIEGTIQIREREILDRSNKSLSAMAVGGCVALSTGNGSSFKNVTTSVEIKCASAGTESSIGGLIGLKKGENGTVTIEKCTGNAKITDGTEKGVHRIGGLIGVHSAGGTISVQETNLTGAITGSAAIADARYGGLISVIQSNPVKMNLNQLTIDGQKIENTASASSGGLLGYEWNNSTVYFGEKSVPASGAVVRGESALKVNGNANAGALVYLATGYWQVNAISLEAASIQNQNGSLGLLLYSGRKSGEDQDTQLLYLEETGYDAYHIEPSGVTVSSSGLYFDEWVVYTCESAETITDNGNSVISIVTKEENGTRKGFDPAANTCTGYQNRTTNSGTAWTKANPNARYYYDLDDIREKAENVNGYVDTPGEAVLWSVWRYCEKVTNEAGTMVLSNIQNYFKTADIANARLDGNGQVIDLTGYSYYPVNVDAASVQIQNCTIVFANQIIESAESRTGSGLDSLVRTTAGTAAEHSQHYLMHSGLILKYLNTSTNTASVTLSVKNVTLQGTIGKGPENTGSGAIICGTVSGSGVGGSHFAKVEMNGVILDGLTVNSDITTEGYAPLLINKAGSYGSIDAQQISTGNYASGQKAATSLIGHVGDENATNISLAFSNGIALSGRTADSIFSHATLLESFQFSGASSSGYYHFNEGEACTYGREINGTVENTGKQLNYFDTGKPVKDGGVTDFNTGSYLPYICQTKVTNPNLAGTFHELEVNIVKPNLIEGCGTYDDPYIITQPAQLELAAQYIALDATAGWQVNMVTDPEMIISDSNTNHTTYTYSNGQWSNNSETCDKETMRDYLRNAYYKIDNDLEMSKFEGLGTTTYPFRGVVEGNGKSVTINAANIASGFVNVSYGSVIQNLTITYTGIKSELSSDKAAMNSNTVANKSYFGGIIGDVKGGDNLIRNVSVSYADNFRIGIKNHLECAGGFLGIVEGGGVIFSEMQVPEGLSENRISWSNSLTAAKCVYVSGLVGRVLDGFVINEVNSTEVSKVLESQAGPDKNYSIGNIASNTTISMNSGAVEISSPEQLLLFSAIINSGACSAGYSLAYQNVRTAAEYIHANSGKVRNADYSHIGDVTAAGFEDQYFKISRKDDANSPAAGNLPYLVTEYAGSEQDFWTLCTSSSSSTTPNVFLNLTITADLDMSVYRNGYRGIGGRYNCTATSNAAKTDPTTPNQITIGQFQRNTPVFAAINGNNHTLTVDNQIYSYSNDNFVAAVAGGLVNMFRRKKSTEVTVQGLTVKGHVELHDFADENTGNTDTSSEKDRSRNYAASAGGVIGRYFTEETGKTSTTYLKLTDLKAEDLTLYSDGAAGGIVGQTGVKTLFSFGNASYQYASGVTYTNCSYNKLTANSYHSTGGIVGAACDNAYSYNYGEDNDSNVTNKIVADTESATGNASFLSVSTNIVGSTGLGGLIGNVGSNVEINKDGHKPLRLDSINLQDPNGPCRTGGGIGFLHHGKTTSYNIIVSNSDLGNGKDDNLGGIVGCWYSTASGGVMENIVIDRCTLSAALSVGGVIGYIGRQGAKIIKNITVKQTKITQTANQSNRGVALIAGEIVGGGIYGENILLKGNTITATANVQKGRIVGKTDDLPIQLLGVSLQYGNDKDGNPIDVSQQPEQDIGSIKYSDYPNKSSAIIISYDAFLTDIENGDKLAGEPDVGISGIGEENKITCDTAEPDIIIGLNGKDGIVKKEGDTYTYIGVKKNYQNVDITRVDKLTSEIVSTYNANQDTKIRQDFNVVQIDGTAACLKQYLNAATNGAFDTAVQKNMIDVKLERYKWNTDNNKFEIVGNAKPTLTYDSNDGTFYATAQYDNQMDMFTLVSVTFRTTANNFARTYHIPVVVRRMLQVDFIATMVSGNVFNAGEMVNYKTHALASAGEDITGYLTFKYNSNLSGQEAIYDWKSYMEGGANLLGYYQKTISTGSEDLPENTQITLIDCQQEERRYYAVVPERKTSKLELFNGKLTFKNSSGEKYQPVSLAELLKISAEPIKDESYTGVKWISLGDNAKGATVVDMNGTYYRLYNEDTDRDIDVFYTLTITNPNPEENYFVIISVPKAEIHMLKLIKFGGVKEGSMDWSNQDTSAPPLEIHQLHRYTDDNGEYTRVDTNKSSEISFNYLDNYSQSLEDQSAEGSIAVKNVDTSVKMQFDLCNTITFNPSNYEVSDPLYQELRVSLKKTVGSTATDVYFPSDAAAIVNLYAYYIENNTKVYFKVNDQGKLEKASNVKEPAVSYPWLAGNDGNMILPFAVLENGSYQYVDLSPIRIEAEKQGCFYLEADVGDGVSIGISSVINNDLLPTREEESQNQTRLHFTSVLSFTENGLSYSTLRGMADGKKGYYLAERRQAVLKLDYLNVDQLGINASDNPSGEINALLTLDLSGAEGFNSSLSKFATLNNADSVVFNFSLKQKGEESLSSTEYSNVSTIGKYLTGLSITGNGNIDSFRLELKKEDGMYPYYNETSGVFSIPITFRVNTDISEYANYRIYASADLRKGNQSLNTAVNAEKAFITYTLAKINVNGFWPKPTGN